MLNFWISLPLNHTVIISSHSSSLSQRAWINLCHWGNSSGVRVMRAWDWWGWVRIMWDHGHWDSGVNQLNMMSPYWWQCSDTWLRRTSVKRTIHFSLQLLDLNYSLCSTMIASKIKNLSSSDHFLKQRLATPLHQFLRSLRNKLVKLFEWVLSSILRHSEGDDDNKGNLKL